MSDCSHSSTSSSSWYPSHSGFSQRAEHEHVADVGGELDAGDQREVEQARRVGQLVVGPADVVLGDAERVEPATACRLDQLLERRARAVRTRRGVGVEVDEHGGGRRSVRDAGRPQPVLVVVRGQAATRRQLEPPVVDHALEDAVLDLPNRSRSARRCGQRFWTR